MNRLCSTRWHGLAVVFACAVAVTPAAPSTKSGRHHGIDMRGGRFQPAALDVAPGDRISWTNHDVVPHTVTAADASWDSGEVPPGGTFTWIAEGKGTIQYRCRYHPGMTGRFKAPQ